MTGHSSRLIKGNVPWNKVDSSQREITTFIGRKLLGGGLLELERVQVICPACGQQVESSMSSGFLNSVSGHHLLICLFRG